MRRLLLRKDVIAWCLYDWADSAFVTSVAVAILPVYFLGLFADPDNVTICGWRTSGAALWGYLNAAYMALAAASAPVLGAIADSARGKKKFLGACTLAGAALTMGLAAAGPGQAALAAAIYLAAGFLWTAGLTFYDAFLPELTDQPGEMDAISSAGYAVGYFGGGLMLAINLAMIARPAAFGLADAAAAARASFVLVGAWWALFTVPLMLLVREGGQSGGPVVRRALADLAATLRRIGRLSQMARFLAAFLLYNSGISTIILVASTFATDDLHLPMATILQVILAVQFVGAPATFGFIYLARKLGSKATLAVGILVYMGVLVYATQVRTAGQFWALGLLVGLVQGGTQAISRSIFGSLIPPGRSAEFFGFFSIFTKVAFLGPLVFAVARGLAGSSRSALPFMLVLFAAGLAILLTVNLPEGRRQAVDFADRTM